MAERNAEYVLRPRTRRRKEDTDKCQDCDVVLTDENWTPSMQRYRRYICGPCWTKRQRRYQSQPGQREKKLARDKERRANWDDERKKLEQRKQYGYWLKRQYGIEIDEYEKILKDQGGRCGICGTDQPTGRGGFHVDHCHDTGTIRSLLCSSCNMMLGMSGDSPDILKIAARYLEDHANRADHKPENRRKEGGKKV